ncbi:IclR family transcriptional regulator domain-containing protein [Arcobacter arenosus]|uniref:IclR family transcriptional regulator n=2 Tax=Arcobacter arenosus TaxID=2576037 RepID=A0A5R8XZR0_9BACT|nr:IclR family transcriptional regulator C-terminal domain-containing protein [Arcobacter arenosus]TLP37717.1 IclR family transcriptional regulator [Arcobacter arenosus]
MPRKKNKLMTSKVENEIDNKEIVTAFIKGLSVIKAFDHENTNMTLSDVAKKVDITRASARRLLLTLESLGYVSHTDNFFSLTPKVIELGYSYFASLPWTDIAYKNIKRVVDECTLSCSISILDGQNVICIMRVPATRILNEGIHVGSRLPAAYTATGRLFMSHMEEKELYNYLLKLPYKEYTSKSIKDPDSLYKKLLAEKNQGYQIVEEEIEDGLLSIAAPIYNRENKMIGAMNIGSHLSYKNTETLKKKVLPLLIEAAKETSEAIKLLQHY